MSFLVKFGVSNAADAINRAVRDPNVTAGDGTINECLKQDVDALGSLPGNSVNHWSQRIPYGDPDYFGDGDVFYKLMLRRLLSEWKKTLHLVRALQLTF